MELIDYKDMHRLLAAFSFANVQNVVTISRWLGVNNRTIEDLVEYVKMRVEFEKNEVTRKAVLREAARFYPDCPKCGHPLRVRRAPLNNKGWLVHMFCATGWEKDDPSGYCGYEEYSTKSWEELVEDKVRHVIETREKLQEL